MAKPSAFLKRISAAAKRDREDRTWYTMMQSQDIAMIALNDAFGFGEDRLKRFSDAYIKAWQDWAAAINADSKDDKTAEYSLTRFEDRLKKICGKHYTPKEERWK